jgi:hypothetical protein
MTAILSLLLVVTLSILVTRIATVALSHTGLARQTARFQARSAFSGAGFTTSESEQVVNHPVRRRIVLTLMLLGNAGIVTAVSSLILAFVAQGDGDIALAYKIVLLVAGLAMLWALASSQWVDHLLSRLVDRALKRFTHLHVSDYEGLLHLGGDYQIIEVQVQTGGWLENRPLRELRTDDEGVLVLGVVSGTGEWLGTPAGDIRPQAGDTLVVYGRTQTIRELTERRAGDESGHRAAVAEQERVAARERRKASEGEIAAERG